MKSVTWWGLYQKRVVRTKFDIYVLLVMFSLDFYLHNDIEYQKFMVTYPVDLHHDIEHKQSVSLPVCLHDETEHNQTMLMLYFDLHNGIEHQKFVL